jgi:hypothetical protein
MFALQSFVLVGFYVAAVLATTIPAFPPLKVDKVIDAAAYMGNLTAVVCFLGIIFYCQALNGLKFRNPMWRNGPSETRTGYILRSPFHYSLEKPDSFAPEPDSLETAS